tara:strand:+ start:264 stop:473 length:210 start_codon:yes stop_codon:yes gene_type:complete
MKTIGLIAVTGGWRTLTFWGLSIGIMDTESLVLKLGLGTLWLGFLLLLIIALVGRFKDSKSDSTEASEL